MTVLAFLLNLSAQAFQPQAEDTTALPRDWFLKDPQSDRYQGVSAEKTYATLLADKPSRTVLVAVIDSGIDIDHEDLKDILWVNEDEIRANGVDDDGNGYIDDMHGWNFIGGKNGNVSEDTYEVTREYARLKPKYENAEEKDVSKKDREEYEYWKKVKKKYDNDSQFSKDQLEQFSQQFDLYANIYSTITYCDSVLQGVTGEPVSKASLPAIAADNDTVVYARDMMMKILENVTVEDILISDLLLELEFALGQLTEAVHHYKTAVEFGYNTEFNSRTIIGDDPGNLYE